MKCRSSLVSVGHAERLLVEHECAATVVHIYIGQVLLFEGHLSNLPSRGIKLCAAV